jgi:DNA-binding NarL/FixJ family response regulator
MPITLALTDDHNLVRKGIIALLKDHADVEVMMEASSGSELIGQLVCRQPDIILLNIEMPVINVYHTLDALKENFPCIKLIVLMMYYDESHVINLMERGANGFLHGDASVEAMIMAIHEVSKNNYYFDSHISATLAKRLVDSRNKPLNHQQHDLSDKELRIIKLICEEHSNKEIAEKLFLSHRTIDTYRERIMQKIGAKNTAGVVLFALRNDLLKVA